MTPAVRDEVARGLAARLLGLPEVQAARTVAAYASFPTEPGTARLRAALRKRGVRVLLPVLLDDGDLAWVEDTGSGTAPPADGSGPHLDRDAVSVADVVICPATAVTAEGARLGKGGGSYDRVLSRLPPTTLVVALVHDDEIVETLPLEPHDQPVDVVVTSRQALRRPPAI